MKNLFILQLMSVLIAGCAGTPATADDFTGRVIEFKSDAGGFDTKTYFYEAKHEVVAFDSQFTPELAREAIEHLRIFTQKPISYLVITHPNPDKFNGAAVFQEHGAQVIASEATAQAIPGVHAYKKYFFVEMAGMFKPGEYPEQATIDRTFRSELDLELDGGGVIVLKEYLAPGVSSNQTVAYVPSADALFVGDLIHYKSHAWLEGGIVNGAAAPTVPSWINLLQVLEAKYPAHTSIFAGRGQETSLSTAVKEQISYLERSQELVLEKLTELGPRVKELSGPEASAIYKDLAQVFEAEFPEYDLSYLIEYGIYGLVLSEAKKAGLL